MKKQLFQAATLLVATMALFTGCDKAENVIEEPTNGLVQVVAKAAAGDTETRIGYSESGNRMNYTWGEVNTERFSVFVPGSNVKHDFLLKGGAHTKKGRFEGQVPEGATTTYAAYPELIFNPADATAIEHNLSNQGLYISTDALFGNRQHLMWATADVNNGVVDYQFSHKVSMLKLELTFTGVTSKIKSVSIYGAHRKAKLNVTNGVLSYEDTGKGEIYAFDNPGFDLVDNVLTAYVYLFPEDLTNIRLSIGATDGSGKEYTSGVFNGRVLNAGTVYRLRKQMTESLSYIVAGGRKWAKGNLIADGANGVKIGAPEDGGLYFQHGSLVGWSGSGNDDGTGRGVDNPLSIRVKPVTCNVTDWDFTWTGDLTSDDPVNGTGDPCRYYFGAPWRLPTKEEFNALFGQEPTFSGHISWGSVTTAAGWSKEGNFTYASATSYASHTSGLKFPASGLRFYGNGNLSYPGVYCFLWSSTSVDDSYASSLHFNYPEVYLNREEYHSYGFPVRCIRE